MDKATVTAIKREHVYWHDPEEPGQRCACPIGHDHFEEEWREDEVDQGQESRAAADWPPESVDFPAPGDHA